MTNDFEKRLRRQLWRVRIVGEWLPILLGALAMAIYSYIKFGWRIPQHGEMSSMTTFTMFDLLFGISGYFTFLVDIGYVELRELRTMTAGDLEATEAAIRADFLLGEALWDRQALPPTSRFVPQR